MNCEASLREEELRREAEESIAQLRTLIPAADDEELDIILDMIHLNRCFLDMYSDLAGMREGRSVQTKFAESATAAV